MRTDHTRRSNRPGGGSAARGGHDCAVARRRSRPQRHHLPPPRRAPPPPSPRGLRRGPPPTLTACDRDGSGARLRPGRGTESQIRGSALADPAPVAVDARGNGTEQAPSPRHPRHDPGAHPRRPRRRPQPQTAHPSPQRSPGPTAHHPRRADHPPHPIPLEDRFVRFLKRHRLPLPEFNQTIAGHEVDAVYRAHKLVVELDSRQFHRTTRAFENDRDRDADLLNAGFSTLRITDHRLNTILQRRSS
jgi:hypothetical protein